MDIVEQYLLSVRPKVHSLGRTSLFANAVLFRYVVPHSDGRFGYQGSGMVFPTSGLIRRHPYTIGRFYPAYVCCYLDKNFYLPVYILTLATNKTCFDMYTYKKAQISLCIRAIWSAYLLFCNFLIYMPYQRINVLASPSSWTELLAF